MTVFMALLLGLLQGATVFLPISHSGHQAILFDLFHVTVPETGMGFFNLLMSVSTLISIVMAYRKELGDLVQDGMAFLHGRYMSSDVNDGRLPPTIRLIYFIILGTLPLILSVPINTRSAIFTENTAFIGAAIFVSGALLFASDKFIKLGNRTEKTMSASDAIIIGLAQAIAAIPGLSRVGATMTVGLSRGFSKDYAVRFAIFLSLPSVILSIVFAFFASFRSGIEWTSFFSYLIGFIVSILAGYLAIQTLRIFARQRKLRRFSYYLWVVGLLTIVLSFIL